jgi:uncharacterized C2H2 Zn-finger protein
MSKILEETIEYKDWKRFYQCYKCGHTEGEAVYVCPNCGADSPVSYEVSKHVVGRHAVRTQLVTRYDRWPLRTLLAKEHIIVEIHLKNGHRQIVSELVI